ncbi:MAG: hypothetical protein ABI239_10480 [Aquihabitans sp.]
MTVWNKSEPLLGKVQKPARNIGCEDGDQSPEHHPEAASWPLAYPNNYELTVIRRRKGSGVIDDVRPQLHHLSVVGPTDNGTKIEAHLATKPRGPRISEPITMPDPTSDSGRVGRITHWTLLDGARCELLVGSSGATSAPHAQTRALRRDCTHDRYQHRRTPGQPCHQRIGGSGPVV